MHASGLCKRKEGPAHFVALEVAQLLPSPPMHNGAMPTDRQNSRLSADVELALVLAETVGVHAAARFLTKRGANFALTCRVLGEPARRRSGHQAVLHQEGLAGAPGGQILLDVQNQLPKISVSRC